MSGANFTDEFKRNAVAQVEDRGDPVREVAERLGVSTKLHDDLCDLGQDIGPNRVGMVHAGSERYRPAAATPASGRLAPQTKGQSPGAFPLSTMLRIVCRATDQGSQFTSYAWQEVLELRNLTQSMSRRGTCWDNAVAERFFNLLKRERIRHRKYKTREEARQDVFDDIELFYNQQRKHVRNGMLSPIDFEQRQKLKLQGV